MEGVDGPDSVRGEGNLLRVKRSASRWVSLNDQTLVPSPHGRRCSKSCTCQIRLILSLKDIGHVEYPTGRTSNPIGACDWSATDICTVAAHQPPSRITRMSTAYTERRFFAIRGTNSPCLRLLHLQRKPNLRCKDWVRTSSGERQAPS